MLRQVARTLPDDGSNWLAALTDAARAVAAVRPPFAGLTNLASAVLDAVDGVSDPATAHQRIDVAVGAFLATLEADAARVVEQATALLTASLLSGSRPCILTVSASSLVERALLTIAGAGPLAIICLESRPAREGAALAQRLAAAGCPVTLAVDAAGPALVAEADLILLGCDTLTPTGLVHKIGTLGLALSAQHRDIPVYALAGPEKLLPSLVRGALADGGPPEEILDAQLAGLTVVNQYFDLTPLDLLDGVVLPDGPRAAHEASHRAATVRVHPALADLLVD